MKRELFIKFLSYPPIGRLVLNRVKQRVLKPFQISLSSVIENQERMLRDKFRRMEHTEIGRKLGIKRGKSLRELPITDYEFYEPFFSDPFPEAFMYPLEVYERMKTSGTAGKEKWFMMPRRLIIKSAYETGVSAIMLSTYDGEKITLEYGDTVYVNLAPRPFMGAVLLSVASGKKGRFPLLNIVPNLNLSFNEKVKYFINNSESLDLAVIQASILVSQIMSATKKKIKLKGIFCPDTSIAETYYDEIFRFAGVPPITFYNSTETLACSIPSMQHRLGFFLDWRRGIFEFIPVEKGVPDYDKILGIDEVEVGKVYQVVYTGFETELTRYNLSNAFKCIAKGDDILGVDHPIFKFHSRLEKTISLHDFTRISEDELVMAFRESGTRFIEFTARKEVERGLEYLTIYVETTGDEKAEEIQESLRKILYEKDRDYRDLVDFYGYVPIRIRLVPRGVFAEYLATKKATISKVDRINMRDEEFSKLSRLIEKSR